MSRRFIAATLVALCATNFVSAADPVTDPSPASLARLVTVYKQLHADPELSFFEKKSSELVAARLRELGFTVTEGVGSYERAELRSYGLVGVLRNGPGPTVMIRTDLDALP